MNELATATATTTPVIRVLFIGLFLLKSALYTIFKFQIHSKLITTDKHYENMHRHEIH